MVRTEQVSITRVLARAEVTADFPVPAYHGTRVQRVARRLNSPGFLNFLMNDSELMNAQLSEIGKPTTNHLVHPGPRSVRMITTPYEMHIDIDSTISVSTASSSDISRLEPYTLSISAHASLSY